MPNKTQTYQLNQWVSSDPVLRTDFNEDNAKIDAALAAKAEKTALEAKADKTALTSLANTVNTKASQAALDALSAVAAAKCQVAFGLYAGDGSAGKTISLGYRPKALFIIPCDGHMCDSGGRYGGLYYDGQESSGMALTLTDDGFQVRNTPNLFSYLNLETFTYVYMAML